MTPTNGRTGQPGATDHQAARPLLGKGFAGVPDVELDVLAAAMSELAVDAGATVVTVDTFGAGIYVIERGEAEVVAGNAMPAAAVLGPGDVFGEIALLLTGERTATVVARTPMQLRALSDVEFSRIRERVPEFERALRRIAAERAAS
jgi:CRP-like cAMP-binding protein